MTGTVHRPMELTDPRSEALSPFELPLLSSLLGGSSETGRGRVAGPIRFATSRDPLP